jgi:hypothetical protein
MEFFDKVKILSPLLTEIGIVAAVILVGILTGIIKVFIMPKLKTWIEKLKKDKFNKDFRKNFEQVHIVNERLKELRIKTNADRAFIARFHNGVQFTRENMHSYFLTITHETVSPGTYPNWNSMQRIPITKYSNIFNEIFNKEDKVIFTNNIKNNDVDSLGHQDFQLLKFEYGIESIIIGLLRNKKNEYIGIYALGWNHSLIEENAITRSEGNEGNQVYKRFCSFGQNVKNFF